MERYAVGLFSFVATIKIRKILVHASMFAYGFCVVHSLHQDLVIQTASGAVIVSAGMIAAPINHLFH